MAGRIETFTGFVRGVARGIHDGARVERVTRRGAEYLHIEGRMPKRSRLRIVKALADAGFEASNHDGFGGRPGRVVVPLNQALQGPPPLGPAMRAWARSEGLDIPEPKPEPVFPEDDAELSDYIASQPVVYQLDVKATFINKGKRTIHCAVEVRTERNDDTAQGTFCSVGRGASSATPEEALQRAVADAMEPGKLADVPNQTIEMEE